MGNNILEILECYHNYFYDNNMQSNLNIKSHDVESKYLDFGIQLKNNRLTPKLFKVVCTKLKLSLSKEVESKINAVLRCDDNTFELLKKYRSKFTGLATIESFIRDLKDHHKYNIIINNINMRSRIDELLKLPPIQRSRNICIINNREIDLSSNLIDLSCLNLNSIPNEIKDAVNITKLIIEYNNIKYISDNLFEHHTNQIEIYVHGNVDVAYNVENPKIKVLKEPQWYHYLMIWKRDNKISDEKLPDDYDSLNQLTELNLANTRVFDVPDEISNLVNLKRINLRNSGLNEDSIIPDSLFKIGAIVELPEGLMKKYKPLLDIIA